MRRIIFTLTMGLLLPILSNAQQTSDFWVGFFSECDNIQNNNFDAAIGCSIWVEDSNGDTVLQEGININPDWVYHPTFMSTPFQYNPDNAPYTLNFDQNCLNTMGILLEAYSFLIDTSNGMGSDTLSICANLVNVHADYEVHINLINCDTSSVIDGCDLHIVDNNGDFYSYDYNGGDIVFFYNPNAAPYFLYLDESCLNSNETFLDSYIFEIETSNPHIDQILIGSNGDVFVSYYQEIEICPTPPIPVILLEVIYSSSCGTAYSPCPVTIVGGTNTPQVTMTGLQLSYHHQFNPSTPITVTFDQNCLNSVNVQLDQYTYITSPTFSHIAPGVNNEISAAIYIDTLMIECSNYVGDSCVNLFSSVSPFIGYHQNTTNYVNFSWGNTSAFAQTATITIDIPSGVTPVTSSFNYPFTVSGSQLTLTMQIPANSNFNDLIIFNVPGGLNNGILHTYSTNIQSDMVDCNAFNNQDSLCMIVGNSYDPNDKTVNQPEIISPDIQNDFVYTIRFQNTGTAPAQDIYIIDTLSSNLDWTTFQLLESSHSVVVSDLGSGVKRFTYDGIWLPDSSSNLVESQGFVSYKITEKAINGEGTEILNTAYIYFDHNPAIVTNTTYNINTSGELNLQTITKDNIVLFPNPASSMIEIKSDAIMDKIEIVDLTGKVCFSNNVDGTSERINVDNLKSGIYFVKIKTEEETIFRLIKE